MAERPANDTNTSWLRAATRPLRSRFRELIAFSFVLNALALATPVFVLQVYDRVVFHAGISTLHALAVGMVFVLLFDFVMRQARSRLVQRLAVRIDAELGRRIFAKLNALPLHTLESRPTAYWQSLFRDAEHVRNVIGGAPAVLLIDLPFVVLFIGLIYLIAAPIVWVLVAALGGFVALAWASAATVQTATRAEQKSGIARDGLVAELMAGRATVKSLALGEQVAPVWEMRHADTIEKSLVRGAKGDTYGNLGAGMAIATTVGLTVFGAFAILDHSMTIGGLIATNMLSSRIIAPLNQLVATWRGFGAYREAKERLSEAFALDEERADTELAFDRPEGVLAVEKVGFRFDSDAKPALDGINFTLKPGGLHGIVGRSGSGKSTLLKLMMGLYPPETGRVLLDKADLSQFSRRQLASWFGYVPQEIFMFTSSIRDNICRAKPEASDEEILAIARRLGLHDEIVDFRDGYATPIGEAGNRLSAGQRQRIAIARALIGDAPVLLLDEPTSNLDRDAEERLRQLLSELARERNVVVVTHSPILLAACHNLIVLERGRIAMAGPAGEIMPRVFAGHSVPPSLERRK